LFTIWWLTEQVFRDGFYGEYATIRTEAGVRIPRDVDPVAVAPLLCAGVTVFNGMRQQGIFPGSLVAVQGLGGLGHLALQYANKMGYRVVAVSSSASKKEFASKLGAHESVVSSLVWTLN
jgi:D-arabinose 1-dehydrogenase-like Zn-dependent alcohol dehydrogenase